MIGKYLILHIWIEAIGAETINLNRRNNMKNSNVSPNVILLKDIPIEHLKAVHQALDNIRQQYGVNLSIKADGRTSSRVQHLPTVAECNYQ